MRAARMVRESEKFLGVSAPVRRNLSQARSNALPIAQSSASLNANIVILPLQPPHNGRDGRWFHADAGISRLAVGCPTPGPPVRCRPGHTKPLVEPKPVL